MTSFTIIILPRVSLLLHLPLRSLAPESFSALSWKVLVGNTS